MIKVVNKKWYKGKGEYIGRPSVLGNPFSHRPSKFKVKLVPDATTAVSSYWSWLRNEYKQGGKVKDELLRLAKLYKETGELTLICHCKQNEEDLATPCHGDVIKYAIERITDV